METVKKSANSWVYRFITRDKVFGMAEGYPQGYLQTTCDIRKYFILSCLRMIFIPLFCSFILLCIVYATIIHPIFILYGICVGAEISVGAYAMAATFTVVDAFVLIIVLHEYGLIPNVLTKTSAVVSEGLEIVKSKVCSKVEWVE